MHVWRKVLHVTHGNDVKLVRRERLRRNEMLARRRIALVVARQVVIVYHGASRSIEKRHGALDERTRRREIAH